MTATGARPADPDGAEEFRRWSLAAAIVCAAHVGLMAGYLLVPKLQPEGAAESPAVIVELAAVPVAPASPDDIAPGPDMMEAQPTPKPPEQAEPEVVEPMPLVEAPAEVTLPLPKPKAVEKKPRKTGQAEVRNEAGPAEYTGAANDGGAPLRTADRGDAAAPTPAALRAAPPSPVGATSCWPACSRTSAIRPARSRGASRAW